MGVADCHGDTMELPSITVFVVPQRHQLSSRVVRSLLWIYLMKPYKENQQRNKLSSRKERLTARRIVQMKTSLPRRARSSRGWSHHELISAVMEHCTYNMRWACPFGFCTFDNNLYIVMAVKCDHGT
jgi:hypothetical protein